MKIHRHLLGTAATATSSGAGGPSSETEKVMGDQFTGARFDTNMVIILAALLCALVFALGLNSIVRCALRFTRRRLSESNDTMGSTSANTGLKKSALRKIPVAVYGSDGCVPEIECPICLAEFVGGDKVRVLPKCNHGFHVGCIDTWLLSHSSCPNCRHSVVDCGRNGEMIVAVAVEERQQRNPQAGSGTTTS